MMKWNLTDENGIRQIVAASFKRIDETIHTSVSVYVYVCECMCGVCFEDGKELVKN